MNYLVFNIICPGLQNYAANLEFCVPIMHPVTELGTVRMIMDGEAIYTQMEFHGGASSPYGSKYDELAAIHTVLSECEVQDRLNSQFAPEVINHFLDQFQRYVRNKCGKEVARIPRVSSLTFEGLRRSVTSRTEDESGREKVIVLAHYKRKPAGPPPQP